MIHLPRVMQIGIIILLMASACQTSSEDQPLPTRFLLPTDAPTVTPSPTLQPTITPTDILPTATFTLTPEPPTETPPVIVVPVLPATETPVPPPPLPELFSFGQSVLGKDLVGRRFGNGPVMILLVGGIHSGLESNTTDLVNEMITHFEITPADVLPGVTLVLIPLLNPDGAEQGRTLLGRFNANGVDLNRNWGCGWEPVAYFRDQEVYPGAEPFSEPEVFNLAAFISQYEPDTVLFYHSAANGVFPGDCNGDGTSDQIASILSVATGYPFGNDFDEYVVTGGAASWVDSLGIPSVDVELSTTNATERERNIAGVMALQCWLLQENAAGIDVCESQVVG